jgi:large subunit ribosomal protein L7Ae
VPFLYVDTQDAVGQAAGLEVGSAAAAIVDGGEAAEEVEGIADRIGDLR